MDNGEQSGFTLPVVQTDIGPQPVGQRSDNGEAEAGPIAVHLSIRPRACRGGRATEMDNGEQSGFTLPVVQTDIGPQPVGQRSDNGEAEAGPIAVERCKQDRPELRELRPGPDSGGLQRGAAPKSWSNERNATGYAFTCCSADLRMLDEFGLRKRFPAARGLAALNFDWSGRLPRLRYSPTHTTAVDHISLSIDAGETLGLVGESGCGKSTLGRLLLRLIEASSGTVEFAGADVRHNGRALRGFRQAAQIVFQNADFLAQSAPFGRRGRLGCAGRSRASRGASCKVPRSSETFSPTTSESNCRIQPISSSLRQSQKSAPPSLIFSTTVRLIGAAAMTARIDTMKGFSWKIHSFFTLSKRKGLPHLSGLRPRDRRFRAQREDPKLVGAF